VTSAVASFYTVTYGEKVNILIKKLFNAIFYKGKTKGDIPLNILVCLFLCFLPACQLGAPLIEQSRCSSLSPELIYYTEAVERSRNLRAQMNQMANTIRQEINPGYPLPSGLARNVSRFRSEYFALREFFFKQVFLNASGMVEKFDSQNQYSVLFRTSYSLFAGTELIKIFHATGALINLHPSIRERWNEPDPKLGIPVNSWNQSLENSQRTVFRDFFRAGLERLKEHQGQLELFLDTQDCSFLVLYAQGIERGIQEIQENFENLELDFIEMYSDEDEHTLIELVEESKKARVLWSQRGTILREAIERDEGLIRGDVRQEVYDIGEKYLNWREALYHLTFKHLPKLTRPDIPYREQDRLRGIGISLLGALTLYGNAQELEKQILIVPEIRKLLNEGNPDRGIPVNFWDEVIREFTKIKHRNLFEEGLWKFEELYNAQEQLFLGSNRFLAYVQAELDENPTVQAVRGQTFFDSLVSGLQFQAEGVWDFFGGIFKGVEYHSTKMFVNIMSMFELREGKLYRDPQWEELIKARLHPGDILLEKSPFRLTERLVPGYFAHAALYLGTEEDLRQLDLLSFPHVQEHLSDVSEDKTIAEALRDGTQLNSLKKFLDIDDLVILRPKTSRIPPEDIREAIRLAFSHIGKKYDFNFDTNSWDSVTCSEMIFHSYLRIQWPYGKVLNSFTIAPDDIAIFAGSDDSRPFSLVTFIHDGQLVHDQTTGLHNEDLYIRLLRGRYTEGWPGSPTDQALKEDSPFRLNFHEPQVSR